MHVMKQAQAFWILQNCSISPLSSSVFLVHKASNPCMASKLPAWSALWTCRPYGGSFVATLFIVSAVSSACCTRKQGRFCSLKTCLAFSSIGIELVPPGDACGRAAGSIVTQSLLLLTSALATARQGFTIH